MVMSKEMRVPVLYFEARCTAPDCRWRFNPSLKSEPEQRAMIARAWEAHLAKVAKDAETAAEFNAWNERSGGKVGTAVTAAVFAGFLLIGVVVVWGLAKIIDPGDSGGAKWDTCDGYREDVAAGSAQDTRDIRNGENPCY